MASDPMSLKALVSVSNEIEASVIIDALADHGIRANAVGGYTACFRAEAPGLVNVLVGQDVSIGMGSVVPSEIGWRAVRAYREWTWDDSRIAEFACVIQQFAIPFLDQWRCVESVRGFLKSSLAAKSQLAPEMAACLAEPKDAR